MKQNDDAMRAVLICAALVLATAAAYWQVRGHEFVGLDDPAYVQENQHVLNGLTRQGIIWAFKTRTMGNWHPLTWLSLMADCHFSRAPAAACHTTNLLFHIANTLLVFLVLKRMTGVVWPGAFVAAAFALHPAHVESVAWVSERKDVLSTFFWMLTMWAYVRYTERPGFGRYLAIVLFFVLGLMAKPMLVTLPFVLLLLDYWPLGRLRFAQSGSETQTETGEGAAPAGLVRMMIRLAAEKVPLFILAAASVAAAFLAQRGAGAIGDIGLPSRIGNAVISYGKYIVIMFWPTKLAAFYPYPDGVNRAYFVLSAILLFCMSLAALLLVRRRPYLAVGWLWYLGTLLPVIGLVKLGAQAMADRYTYVPLTGLFIIIAWVAADIVNGKRYRRVIFGAAGVSMVLILGVGTWFQARYWQNSLVLYQRALDVTSNNALVHNNLGVALKKQGRLDDAIEQFRKALRIYPPYNDATANLGASLVEKGLADEAAALCREYLRVGRPDYRIQKLLGDALVLRLKISSSGRFGAPPTTEAKRDFEEAVEHYRQAVQLKPDYLEAHYCLAEALTRQGKPEAAIGHYRQVLRLSPDHSGARRALQASLTGQNNSGKQMNEDERP
jgi:tetratricopeptide (TPR) repeat protein